jgi:hypothetical protein
LRTTAAAISGVVKKRRNENRKVANEMHREATDTAPSC